MGIGKVVLHDREDVVMIAPYEKAVVLYKLRSPQEIRNIHEIPQLDGKSIDPEGLKLARSLVESMSTTLDKIDLTDTYHEALRAIIEAKIAGRGDRHRRRRGEAGGGHHDRPEAKHRAGEITEEADGKSRREGKNNRLQGTQGQVREGALMD